jgi:membrane protein implicated in regulation of membrane protease activity
VAAVVWLIVAIGLVVAEVFTVDLVLLMLAVGAFAAAGTALLTDEIVVQVLVFAAVSVLALFGVRPMIKKRMLHHADDGTPLSVAAIEGAVAVVLERVDTDQGLVKIQGDTWTARAFDATQVMEPGERVKVVEVKGATALVWKDF